MISTTHVAYRVVLYHIVRENIPLLQIMVIGIFVYISL